MGLRRLQGPLGASEILPRGRAAPSQLAPPSLPLTERPCVAEGRLNASALQDCFRATGDSRASLSVTNLVSSSKLIREPHYY